MPLLTTGRVAVIDLTTGEAVLVGESVPNFRDGPIRFSSGVSAAVAADGRLFVADGDSGIRAVDTGSGSDVVLSR